MTKIADVNDNPMSMPSDEELLVNSNDCDQEEMELRRKLDEEWQYYDQDKRRIVRRLKRELIILVIVGVAAGFMTAVIISYAIKYGF